MKPNHIYGIAAMEAAGEARKTRDTIEKMTGLPQRLLRRRRQARMQMGRGPVRCTIDLAGELPRQ
nr:hypothetical protein [Maliibacterium massiliense]